MTHANNQDGSNKPASSAQPFEVDQPNAYKWTKDAFQLLQAGELSAEVRTDHDVRSAVVHGECPRCSHDVHFTQILDAVTGESMTTLGATTAPASARSLAAQGFARTSSASAPAVEKPPSSRQS